MHYNSGNLPSFVQRVSEDIQKGWIEVNNASLDKYGEKKAFLMANAWLKRQLPKKRESFIKRSAVEFNLHTENGFIKRSADGNDYITFVLNSTSPHRDGTVFDEPMLQEWADYI